MIPERLTARQEVRQAIDVHFWEQPIQSAHALDGLAYSLPAEPLPLAPLPSGLSRTQQLLAAQALSIPVLPAFDGREGGVVRLPALLYLHLAFTSLGRLCRLQSFICHCQA